MNIRKYYFIKTGLEVPLKFDIHHIDHDRGNNKIMNLVAIPKGLHRSYHTLFDKMKSIDKHRFATFVPNETLKTSASIDFDRNMSIQIDRFQVVKWEIFEWVLYRDSLIGFYYSQKSINKYENYVGTKEQIG